MPSRRLSDQQNAAEKNAGRPRSGTRFVTEAQRRLKGSHERIAALGASVIAEIDDQARSSREATNLTIGIRSAEAQYQQAKSVREIAEIAVLEYEQGIYVQDEVTAKGEIKLGRVAS